MIRRRKPPEQALKVVAAAVGAEAISAAAASQAVAAGSAAVAVADEAR